jgi:class 3 adenylate cyclase
MAGRAPGAAAGRGGAPRVKLSDFGLARHIEESASLMMTQPDALVGTPLYMAPEQCLRGPIDARTDVYSLGVTLYHLLAGRPPFVASRLMDIIAMHQTEAPPPLRRFHPGVSDGACQLVEKAMAKAPEARYADAEAMLRDLERLRRGEPTSIAVHPRLPAADPRDLLHFDFRWDLESDPRQLWPLVSNTERLNRAIGLPAVRFLDRAVPGQGVRRHGQASVGGLPATWEEHPFEWVEPRRLGVLRSYDRGPLKWMVSRVDLASRPGGGTTLTHQVWMAPNIPGLLLRRALALQVRRGLRHSLDRVYRRIDAACAGRLGTPGLVDPFAEPPALAGARRARLERLLDLLIRRGLDIEVVERLGEYLTQAPAQEVARLRPLALAHRLGLEPDAVVAFCLHGAKEGLLVLLWDILCPACRIPSEVQDSLRALRDHAHCAACDLDFDLDFARNVELVFRVHPEIREADLGTYCIGGPAHSPHVVAQVRVAAGERLELELELSEGSYRLRGPQLPYAVDLRVQPHAPARRWELALAEGPEPEPPRVLRSGAVVLALANEHDRELVVRLERTATRDDALTAARASSLALFRELFADEVLGPGQLASVASVTLLVTDLDRALRLYQELGDGRAFTVLREHFRRLDERVRGQGGAVIKTLGEGVLASFTDPAAAVRAALDLLADPPRDLATCGVRVRAGLHRGAAMVTTLNDHLDYFGSVVSQTTHLLEAAGGEDLVRGTAIPGAPGRGPPGRPARPARRRPPPAHPRRGETPGPGGGGTPSARPAPVIRTC